MSQILSPEALAELTGSKLINRQKKVLSEHGIGFIVRHDGKISTTWEAVHSALNHSNLGKEPPGPTLDFLSPRKSD
jgi:hypothetical protein